LFNSPHWFGPSIPFWFAATLATINVLCVIAFLPETHKHISATLKMHWAKSLTNIKRAALHPSLRVIFTAEFLFWGGFTFFTTFFQILLIKKLGYSQSNIGDFFAYIGIWIAISQAVFVPFLAKHFSNAAILRVGLFGIGFALLLQLLPNNTTQLLLVAPFIAIFNGMVIANASALVSSITGRKSQGEVFGIEASVQALAQAIPAIIAGYVAVVGINLPVIVGGLSALVAGVIFAVFYRPPKHLIEDVEPI
jgi:DHA1 family tetracycline resistance protein-like MFS transporter